MPLLYEKPKQQTGSYKVQSFDMIERKKKQEPFYQRREREQYHEKYLNKTSWNPNSSC